MGTQRNAGLQTAGEILHAALDAQRARRSLPLDAQTSGPDRHVASPVGGDHVEDLIATTVAAALGVAVVPRGRSFAALGGDSLMATRVLARIWRAFEVKLPFSAVIPDGTVCSLTEAVQRTRHTGVRARPPLMRRAGRGAQELSANQAAVWLADSAIGPSALYNIPHCLRLRGPLAPSVLQRALGRLVRDHEALRMRFTLRAGRLVQEPCATAAVPLPSIDLTAASPEERERRAPALATRHVRAPFDLERPPLLRALLIRLGPAEHMLVLVVHHIVCDAWSLKLLMGQLSERCSEEQARTPQARTPQARTPQARTPRGPAPRFLDFVAWQRATSGGRESSRIVAAWRAERHTLLGAPALPSDRPRPAVAGGAGAIVPLVLAPALVGRLRRLSGEQGVTLYMTLLGALAIVVRRRTDSELVIVGSPLANRAHHALGGIVGYLANMVPMRVECGGDPTVRELLGRVRSATLVAYDRQSLPFAQLVRELGPPRTPGANPIFQIALTLNDMSVPTIGPAQVTEVLLHTGTAKLDLTLYLEERAGGGLDGYLEYASDLFDAATIECLRSDLEQTLNGMVDFVDQRLSEMIAFT